MNFNSKINFSNLLKPYNVAAKSASFGFLKKQKSIASSNSVFQKSFGSKPSCLLGKNIMSIVPRNSFSALSAMLPGKLGSISSSASVTSVLSMAACSILPVLSKRYPDNKLLASLGNSASDDQAKSFVNLDNEAASLDSSQSAFVDKLTDIFSSVANSETK